MRRLHVGVLRWWRAWFALLSALRTLAGGQIRKAHVSCCASSCNTCAVLSWCCTPSHDVLADSGIELEVQGTSRWAGHTQGGREHEEGEERHAAWHLQIQKSPLKASNAPSP